LWKFTQFWNYEAPSFTNLLFNILNKTITHYRCPTTSLLIVNISFVYLWIFYIIVLQFLHFLHFCPTAHNSRWICAELVFLAWRKQITERILQLAASSIARHITIHSVETRTNTRWPVMLWFTRQWAM
jgi:hypothetical protein